MNKLKHPFLIIATLLLVSCGTIKSQEKTTYQPTWESLDSRPIPDWFQNAKFGIFIHWGPYSVPAWSPKGTYSEWYQRWLQSKSLFGNGNFKGDEVYQFHKKIYGEDFTYYDFGKLFTADLFDADEWAKLIEKSGAKYTVLTSKHHDGFTLWPNKEANDRGFAWNSMEVGAKRDLVGEFVEAVKKTNVKAGLYYSLYEWYHPWWQNDKKRFVDEHFLPQIKDLVTKYNPDVLWADGEWSMEAEKWKSKEFLTWLFNESAVKNSIVINDRWGKGVRKKHGGYFTTEYESEPPGFNRPWEECRGMGFSFGYNQNEDIQDYNSPKALVLTLINIVSTGGNLLLDIGPDARGNIPVIMQERLLQIGGWLETNGEAIYNTRLWNNSFQWSLEGEKNYKPKQHYLGSEVILKQTIDPEPGYAVKELFFTQNDEAHFVILPQWKDKVVVRNFKPSKRAKITLLATNEILNGKQSDDDYVINLPIHQPNKMKETDTYAYVIKIYKN
jgi:alpha-L-fucosidase